MFDWDRALRRAGGLIVPRDPTSTPPHKSAWLRAAATLLATTSLLALGAAAARAADDPAPANQAAAVSNEALLKKLDAMEKRIRMLEGQLRQANTAAPAPAAARATRTATGPHAEAAAPTETKATPADAKTTPADAKTAPADAKTAPADAKTTPADAKTTPADAKATPASAPAAPASKPILGVADSPVAGLSIGAYGEFFFGAQRNPAAGGQWQGGFDARRFVLLPVYQITDNIIFNAEIEFEHAGSGFDNDDKLHGTAEIEQLWIDFKIVDQFNWRAPGIDLVPIGYINQHHEPTQFYSVLRPELYNGLIPSTWKVPGSSVYGTITEGLKYQVMVSASQEDFGDSFDGRTEAKTVPPFPIPYAAGITGLDALGFSNPPLGDFQQLTSTMAVSGRLDFAPTFWPGFAGSVSAYYSPNTTPRGAHDDMGNFLGHSSLTMFDAEFRYRVPNTGFEMRGEYVQAWFGNPANLRANNDSDPTNNVGRTMWGASGEIAYHVPLGTILNSEWEAVPFYRYTRENLQTAGFAGTDDNTPTGAGQLQFHSAGVAVFPSPKLVLKANYRKVINKDPAGANADSFLGAVGFFF
jgi:hypothetical protein